MTDLHPIQKERNVPSCHTCENLRFGGRCSVSGYYAEIERKYMVGPCSSSGKAWAPRLGLLARIHRFFHGVEV